MASPTSSDNYVLGSEDLDKRAPYWKKYDHRTLEAVTKETRELGEQWKGKGEKYRGELPPRLSYGFQRARRNAGAPTRQQLYDAHLELKDEQVPRNPVWKDQQKAVRGEYINIAIVSPYKQSASLRPCFIYVHGGARIGGNQYTGLLDNGKVWSSEFDAITVSVDYRLSPGVVEDEDGKVTLEATHEGPANDCHDVIEWVSNTIGKEGPLQYADPSRIILIGSSAGGGIAVGAALKWNTNKDTPLPAGGIMLEAPQLDDRCDTASHKQYCEGNMFNSVDARYGWDMSLNPNGGDNPGEATIYEAPARAGVDDLWRLPPTYLDVGTVEPFRDEVSEFAARLKEAGVPTDLETYEGGWHGSVSVADAPISQFCVHARLYWLSKALGSNDGKYKTNYDNAKVAWENDKKLQEKEGIQKK
ncbi:Alpha/Beta hydrolase protein [Xylariaceae sp. FL0016]|nr:Alpha/Beta hydrolase protein [Xylariaceae sp. FL0016]